MKKRFLILCLSALLFIQPLAAYARDGAPADGPLLSPTPVILGGNNPDSNTNRNPDPGTLNLQTEAPKDASQEVDPADIPDILLEEMADVENNCNANAMYSAFHDCRCIAVKFLDARLKSDPDRSKDIVFNAVSNQCPNPPGIAGYIYKSCADVMKNERPQDFDKFCTCSANQVAETYAKTPMMNIRYIDGLRKNAFINCGIGNNPAYNSPYLQK
jgi:hypothetical protein